MQNSLYRITPLKKKKEKTYTHAFACIEGEHVEDRDIETGAGGGPWGGILGGRERGEGDITLVNVLNFEPCEVLPIPK